MEEGFPYPATAPPPSCRVHAPRTSSRWVVRDNVSPINSAGLPHKGASDHAPLHQRHGPSCNRQRDLQWELRCGLGRPRWLTCRRL